MKRREGGVAASRPDLQLGGCAREQGSQAHAISQNKKEATRASFSFTGGEGGIRTHEGLLTLAGFQDQCIQPLCHLSELSIVPGWDELAACGGSPLRGALRAF